MLKIIISFATEFCELPEMDDVLLRIINSLDKRGLIGNFHLTGERARILRQRNRKDVINALKNHEIGYHTNTHGAYPFLGQVCENQSWDEAVSDIMYTEARGIMDIRDIFDTEPKYFVTEFTKAPQVFYAMRALGIDLNGYTRIPSSGNPFAWFTGSLCYTGVIAGLEKYPSFPQRLGIIKQKVDDACLQATEKYSDNLIKVFLHPYKILCPVEALLKKHRIFYKKYPFYSKDWILPDATFDKATVEKNIDEFESILDYIKGKKCVFVPTSEIAKDYKNNVPEFLAFKDAVKLSAGILESFTFKKINKTLYFSPAEIFGILTFALAHYHQTKKIPAEIPFRRLLGPVENFKGTFREVNLRSRQILAVVPQLERDVDFYQRVPSVINIGNVNIPPESFLAGIAEIVKYIAVHNKLPGEIALKKLLKYPEISLQPYFQEKTFVHNDLYPEGFTGEKICRYSMMQSWSYKPAVKKS
jgi:peptidoglycan/xylan/chitin deacetylase (PgdA/CDA1 family)